ncbi:MAG: GNAT family N-acetyltransferase [Cyanobacteria bacterium P01_F01_bin.153]
MDIVPLKTSDFAIAIDCLAAAFAQDPLISHFLPDDAEAKRLALEKMSQGILNCSQPDHIYTTAERPKGVAIWSPPEDSEASLAKLWNLVTSGLLQTPLYLRWDRLLELVWLLSTVVQMHERLMPEPHWYLGMLGVSPQCQGQGIGGRLIQPTLELADRSNTPCYLETTTPAAVRFYERHGFQTIHQDFFVGHPYWAMKRSPQQD